MHLQREKQRKELAAHSGLLAANDWLRIEQGLSMLLLALAPDPARHPM